MERLTSARVLLEKSFGAQFLLALIVIIALKWPTLDQPPVWDTAMGLFPAAITLAGNGFDVVELLGMPTYLEGGPNTHSTSPVTLTTAFVLKVSGGGGRALVILHLLHFAGTAMALVFLFRLARPVFGSLGTFLLCLSVLLHPVFSAQVGFLYIPAVGRPCLHDDSRVAQSRRGNFTQVIHVLCIARAPCSSTPLFRVLGRQTLDG